MSTRIMPDTLVAPTSSVPLTISPTRSTHPVRSFVAGMFGWTWRLFAGAALCFNLPVLSYFTSIIAFGWFYRWMQTVAVYGWWKRSPRRGEMTFQEFCDTLGPNGPAARPRLFIQERFRKNLMRPDSKGRPVGPLVMMGRLLGFPLHSLWRNFMLGLQGLICTYLLTGWGCLILLFAWKFGWDNSFFKGYEDAIIGPLTGSTGIFLFSLAMIYVPMAQAHQAVSGQARSFFQFRVVYRLIRACLRAYAGIVFLTVLLAFPLMAVIRLPLLSDDFPGNSAATNEEGAVYLRQLLYAGALLLFLCLLLVRTLTAMAYRAALLKCLRRGWIQQAELAPNVTLWLNRLEVMPIPLAAATGVLPVAGAVAKFPFRFVIYTVILLFWVLFMVRYLISYFLVADGFIGFINHPLVQFPCTDYVPVHMW